MKAKTQRGCEGLGIALLVPRETMVGQAEELMKKEGFELLLVKHIQTANAISEARKAVADGAAIVIARGSQAYLIKEYTNIPVVEITLTGQEIGRLLKQAKILLNKEYPRIGIIGFENMFPNMDFFGEIFDMDLRCYFGKNVEELEACVEEAIENGADLVIGGDTVMAVAGKAGVPALFLESTEDSLREAIEIAEKAQYAAEIEKRNNAQMATLLDYSFSGIIKLTKEGRIMTCNHIMEEILGKTEESILGFPIWEVMEDIDERRVISVLQEGKDFYSSFIRLGQSAMVVILAPILVDERIEGGILSCHVVKKLEQVGAETLRERYLHGFVARRNFSNIFAKSREMHNSIELAKLYAQSSNPVLLYGETGTEKELLAEGIHNNSLRKNGPFVSVNCGNMEEKEQQEMLFGRADSEGAIGAAKHGTLYIAEIEKLGLHIQYQLFHLMKYHSMVKQDIENVMTPDVRIIADTSENLAELRKKDKFRADLYYLLTGLTVEVPPLRNRREDMELLIENTVRRYKESYSRYHTLTQGAKDMLLSYSWEGNILQMESFLERLILTARRRSIDEIQVQRLLEEMYPVPGQEAREHRAVYKNSRAEELIQALERYDGDRTLAAQELGISKTTLWRHMKKYGITGKYEI